MLQNLLLLLRRVVAREQLDRDRERREAPQERAVVLIREDGRRREDGHLLAVHHRLERRAHRHFGLAVSDVAAQQPVHRLARLHVRLHVVDRRFLILGLLEFERILELELPRRVLRERVPLHHLPRGVELEQLVRHVAHRLLDRGLRARPGRAAELVELRLRVRAAGVLLDEIEVLHRHQQLAAAGVLDLHHFALGRPERNALQPVKAPDAVIDVDDVVAHLQIAQIGDERLGRALLAADARGGRRLEEVPLGVNGEVQLLEVEPARQRARTR